MKPTPDIAAPSLRNRLIARLGVGGAVAVAVVAIGVIGATTVAFARGSGPGVWLGLKSTAHHPGGGITTTTTTTHTAATKPSAGGGSPAASGTPSSVTAVPAATALPTTTSSRPPTPTTVVAAGTTTTSGSAPATVTVTESDYGKHYVLHKGDRLVAQLSGPAMYTWTEPASSNDGVLHRSSGTSGTTAGASFVATADGQARVTATGDPTCLAAGCRVPSRLLSVDVSVAG